MTNGYKTPVLATLFGILGILAGLGFIILLGFALVMAIDSKSIVMALPNFFLAGWALLATIIYFGIGQILDAICRTAYFTQRNTDLLERMSRGQEITQQSLAQILANGPASGASPLPPAEPRGYYYVHDGKVEGPHPEATIRRLYNSGEITGETLAMRKGDRDWVPLSQLFPQ